MKDKEHPLGHGFYEPIRSVDSVSVVKPVNTWFDVYERRLARKRLLASLKDVWLWSYAVYFALEMAARMSIVTAVYLVAAKVGFYFPVWFFYLAIFFVLAPFVVYLHEANVRKRLIALEVVNG